MATQFRTDASGNVLPQTVQTVPDRVQHMLDQAVITPAPQPALPEREQKRRQQIGEYARTRQQRLREARFKRVRDRGQQIGQQSVAIPTEMRVGDLLVPLKTVGDIVRPVYQRPLDENRALGYAEDFNWTLLGRLDVNVRDASFQGAGSHNNLYRTIDGTRVVMLPTADRPIYAVLDGQHRALAVVFLLGMDALVPVDLYHVPDMATEAKVFEAVNTTRVKLTHGVAFNARLESGDEVAIGVMTTLRAYGLRPLEQGEPKSTPGTISASRTMEMAYVRGGSHSLWETLRVIKAVWGFNEESLKDWVVAGVWSFLVTFQDHDHYREQRLFDVLKGNGTTRFPVSVRMLEELALQQRASLGAGRAPACMAAIHELYNQALKERYALPAIARRRQGSTINSAFAYADAYRRRHNPDSTVPKGTGNASEQASRLRRRAVH